MLSYVVAIAGLIAVNVLFGVLMVGAHEHQRAEKKRLDMGCSSCSSSGSCSLAKS